MRFWLTFARATTFNDCSLFLSSSTSRFSRLSLSSYTNASKSPLRRGCNLVMTALKVVLRVETSSGSCSANLRRTRSSWRGLLAARACSSAASRSSSCLIRSASSSACKQNEREVGSHGIDLILRASFSVQESR